LTYNPLIDTVYGKNLSWYSWPAINPPMTVTSGVSDMNKLEQWLAST
jgi:hypothetical protein